MARFDCEWLRDGVLERGRREAPDEAALRLAIEREGGVLLSARRLWTWPGRRLSLETVSLFLASWAALLRSGMPLSEALALLAEGEDGQQASLSASFAEGLLSGESLSVLWRRHPELPPEVADWLRLGEARGQLAEALEQAAEECLERHQMRKRLLEQAFYPLLLLTMVVAVGLLFVLIVLPALAATLLALEAPLPGLLAWPMRLAAAWHAVPLPLVILIPPALAGIVWLSWKRRPEARRPALPRPVREWWEWRIYADFALFLGRLLETGAPLPEALTLVRGQRRFRALAADIEQVQAALYRGAPFLEALDHLSILPPLARGFLANGQATGQLPEGLIASARTYSQKSAARLGWLQRLIEPVAIGILGLMVLGLALSFFLPLLDTYSGLLP